MKRVMETDDYDLVDIDEMNLDKECLRLPRDYLRAAQRSADSKNLMDRSKLAVDEMEAKLSKKIRDNPEKFGLEKITESAVKSAISIQPDFQNTMDVYLKAKHKQELAQALVWAMEHKKRSLSLLVDLHGMGYFSSPRISKSGKQAVDEMTKMRVRRPRDDS